MTSPTPEGQRVASILDVRVSCRACDWRGAVGEARPDVDGEGSLGCGVCGSVLGTSRREHILTKDCWCYPTVTYVDPVTGNKVVVHHEPN